MMGRRKKKEEEVEKITKRQVIKIYDWKLKKYVVMSEALKNSLIFTKIRGI